jgi:hypothetical protein
MIELFRVVLGRHVNQLLDLHTGFVSDVDVEVAVSHQ